MLSAITTCRYVVGTALLSALFVAASDNGLARTPQLGWNNWNTFGCDVSEELLTGTADKIVELGLKDVGYHYVILDDCWSDGRFENGSLRPDEKKFPSGMSHVAEYIHSLGLGFGMYGTAGSMTCGRYAGSLGHEETDADSFASWGVDYLKYDNCFNEGQSGTPAVTYERYKKMADALNATGRPILYSMCNWGEDYPWKWAQTVANSWRMSGDITDEFNAPDPRCPCTGDEGTDCALPGFHCSMMNILNKMSAYPDKGIPGAWNDLDMLEVGNGGMNDEEYKLHFTMWAAVKSPLIMGNDIRLMDASTYSILTNPAILALSQDPAGSSAVRRWRYHVNDTDRYGMGEIQMWSGSLAHGDHVVILLNAGNQAREMNATLADIFKDNGGKRSKEAQRDWDLYDLWANRMENESAQAIINGNSSSFTSVNTTSTYYNATAMPYEQGIRMNNMLLMGTLTGHVEALGTITAHVPRHGVVAYRLKPHGKGLRKRDEL